MTKIVFLIFVFLFLFINTVSAQICVNCHKKMTPGIVSDWEKSLHSKNGIDCTTCHGSDHNGPSNINKVKLPTPEVCGTCHEDRVEQFKKGKHSLAWASMNAMPTAHWQPIAMIEGKKGCGGCHKVGLKSENDILEMKKKSEGYGVASCDVCHTRHTFSREEAKQPQACQTCHMGFDHPQWEMFSSSKHGVRFLLKQNKVLSETSVAPTCQTCHMSEGNHEVRTAWGFLGVRLPMPENKQWAEDRTTIMQALGVLDSEGKPTKRLDIVKAADVVRLTQDDWQKERDKMIKICSGCHSKTFAKGELEKGDNMIMEADKLMAEAIRIVASLYKDGIIAKPKEYASAFPDVLTFHDAPTVIEKKLFVMYLEHRMRSFQGAFHMNPDYSFWYGWSEMNKDLAEIKESAENIRRNKSK